MSQNMFHQFLGNGQPFRTALPVQSNELWKQGATGATFKVTVVCEGVVQARGLGQKWNGPIESFYEEFERCPDQLSAETGLSYKKTERKRMS